MRRLDSPDGGIRGQALQRLQRHPADDRIVRGGPREDDAAERLDLFFELGPDLGANVDQRSAVAIDLDARSADLHGPSLRIAAAVVDRGKDPPVDFLLRERADVALAAIRRTVPLRPHRGHEDGRDDQAADHEEARATDGSQGRLHQGKGMVAWGAEGDPMTVPVQPDIFNYVSCLARR